ncbi:MAG: elongation factor P [Chloroflexi bacterium RBG_13_51_18]|nr:MAG: elongation factor P [Chloroflexi bacterium RBG_13_51_18]
MEISGVRKNSKLIIDGALYNVEEAEFTKPGKGRSVYRLRLKNLRDGRVVDRTYRSGESVDEASLNTEEEQYLYHEGDQYIFMNSRNYEQHGISEEQLGIKKNFLKEGMEVVMLMMGDEAIDINLPLTIDLKVIETEISTKTATITPQNKMSVVETGYSLGTPAFIKVGDVIKIDTRTGNYVERVATGK